jgi:hypothetical protein
MRKIAVSLVAAALVLARAAAAQQPYPSAAQPTYPSAPPDSSATPERFTAARLLFGAAGVTNGFYCSYGYALSSCSSLYQYKQVPFFVGGEFEAGGRAFGVAVGVHDLNGPYLDVNRNFVEPILDLVLRLGSYSGGLVMRFRIGAGLYVGENWKTGFVGRGGFGLTFRGRSPLGLAADLSWEGGGFNGNTISVVKLGIGPEIAF